MEGFFNREPGRGLIIDEDEMRRAGLESLNMIIDHFLKVEQEPVIRKRSRREFDEMFDLSLPVLHLDHPRCLPQVSTFSTGSGSRLRELRR